MKKNGRPLSQLTGLKAEYIHSFNKLWLTTVEDIAGILRLPEIHGEIPQKMIIALFADELGISNDTARKEVIEIIRNSVPDNEWYAMAAIEEPLSFGLLIEEDEEISFTKMVGSESPLLKELPTDINLLEQFPESFFDVHDQGQRGTCVAFVVTTLHEYIHSKIQSQTSPHLSEEFLYWTARRLQYRHAPESCHQCGTYIKYALNAVIETGQCLAETKPYKRELPCNLKFAEGDIEDTHFICQICDYGNKPAYLPTGSLEPKVREQAENFRLSGWTTVKLSTIKEIKSKLSDGYPVVIGVPCYLTWQSPTCRHSGVISLPFQKEIDDYRYHLGNHAMLVAGYKDDLDPTISTPGGGYFIIRNSWGKTWGDASPVNYPPGNGMLPYAYLTRQFLHAYTLEAV